MNKQEIIREGIERILDELLFSPGESEDGYTYNLTGCITNLLIYLHSQGLRFPNGEALIDETNE